MSLAKCTDTVSSGRSEIFKKVVVGVRSRTDIHEEIKERITKRTRKKVITYRETNQRASEPWGTGSQGGGCSPQARPPHSQCRAAARRLSRPAVKLLNLVGLKSIRTSVTFVFPVLFIYMEDKLKKNSISPALNISSRKPSSFQINDKIARERKIKHLGNAIFRSNSKTVSGFLPPSSWF